MSTRLVLIATGLAFTLSTVAHAQRGPQTQTLTGTVKEIQEQGRISTLVVTTDDGQEHEFRLTPKVQFEVTAPGDEGFVRPGVFMSAQGVLTNNQLFIKSLNVYLIGKGQRAPAGRFAKAPAKVGASENTYDISGTIVAKQENPDYPDYEVLAIKAAGRTPPVMLEKGFEVTIVGMTPEMAQPEAPVELEVTPLRGDRFNLVKATVKLSDPLDSATVFAGDDEAN
jgi:hypothetical protein